MLWDWVASVPLSLFKLIMSLIEYTSLVYVLLFPSAYENVFLLVPLPPEGLESKNPAEQAGDDQRYGTMQ